MSTIAVIMSDTTAMLLALALCIVSICAAVAAARAVRAAVAAARLERRLRHITQWTPHDMP